jgi:1-aminocyclopropane-1-carboxylate deaminase
MLFDISNISTTVLKDDLFTQKQVNLAVLRLDRIHPVVSGNKLFKLHYFLEEAIASDHKTMLSFGGAWSNHLPATAFASRSAGLKSIGIVRGERPAVLSFTLQQCIDHGMELKFVSRELYAAKEDLQFIQSLKKEFGECIVVPEGGYHASGAKGAAMIMDMVNDNNYTHICSATGTATTLAGLLMSAKKEQVVIGVSVLKGMTDIKERIELLTNGTANMQQLQLFNDHHFGGYAKKTPELIRFMNQCWQQFQLPLDVVYTAKMLYAVFDAVRNDHFPENSRILCLHTGGLYGNHSLPVDSLLY